MRKIVIDYIYGDDLYARSKAPKDVNEIAQEHGFELFLINTRTTMEFSKSHPSPIRKLIYNFRKLFILLKSVLTIKKNTLVLLQYPFSPYGITFTLFFYRCLKLKKCHLFILVHDIISFRQSKKFSKTEINIFNTASELILHTLPMQKLFKDNGIDRPCHLLWLFDYLTDEAPNNDNNNDEPHSIAFAGALGKSEFLKHLKTVEYSGIQMHLYGNKPSDTAEYPNWMKYIGRFSPDNVTMLTEDWGLAWDGDSIAMIHGPLGDYLRYNSSHKISLYIAAGIPVIVSEESALAGFVKENKLGITVSSLLELDKRIALLDETEYQLIRDNVAKMSAILRKGRRLGAILDDIVRNVEGIQPQDKLCE